MTGCPGHFESSSPMLDSFPKIPFSESHADAAYHLDVALLL